MVIHFLYLLSWMITAWIMETPEVSILKCTRTSMFLPGRQLRWVTHLISTQVAFSRGWQMVVHGPVMKSSWRAVVPGKQLRWRLTETVSSLKSIQRLKYLRVVFLLRLTTVRKTHWPSKSTRSIQLSHRRMRSSRFYPRTQLSIQWRRVLLIRTQSPTLEIRIDSCWIQSPQLTALQLWKWCTKSFPAVRHWRSRVVMGMHGGLTKSRWSRMGDIMKWIYLSHPDRFSPGGGCILRPNQAGILLM